MIKINDLIKVKCYDSIGGVIYKGTFFYYEEYGKIFESCIVHIDTENKYVEMIIQEVGKNKVPFGRIASFSALGDMIDCDYLIIGEVIKHG